MYLIKWPVSVYTVPVKIRFWRVCAYWKYVFHNQWSHFFLGICGHVFLFSPPLLCPADGHKYGTWVEKSHDRNRWIEKIQTVKTCHMKNKYGMLQYQEKEVKIMIIHHWLNDLRQPPFYYMQLEAEVVICLSLNGCNDYTEPSKIIVKATKLISLL